VNDPIQLLTLLLRSNLLVAKLTNQEYLAFYIVKEPYFTGKS
jgi:hypothetical protein